MKRLSQVEYENKRVFLRADLNVPMAQGKIVNERKLCAILPTLALLKAKRARILLVSHLGRPQEGIVSSQDSLKPVAERLTALLGSPVRFAPHWIEGVEIAPGEVVLGENVRFLVGENSNDPALAEKMATLCDVFVMDAFPCAHRTHASTAGIIDYAPLSCAGPSLLAECDALSRYLAAPKRPWVAVVGGAKISSKFHLLRHLLSQVDALVVGGGIANAFLQEAGIFLGSSLVHAEAVEQAKELRALALKLQKALFIPSDGIVAPSENVVDFASEGERLLMKAEERIADIGPNTLQRCRTLISQAGTVIWNGPLGIYEKKPYEKGTQQIAEMIAESSAISVVGGGELVDALDRFGFIDKISYVSMGGGAFLEYLSGTPLPVLAALEKT